MGLADWIIRKSAILKSAFEKISKEFLENSDKIKNISSHQSEQDKEISKLREDVVFLLKELTPRTTPRSTPRTTPRSDLRATQKFVLRKFDKAELHHAIKELLDKNLPISQIQEEIEKRFDVKKTCFFKHLAELRELRGVTPRSSSGRRGVIAN